MRSYYNDEARKLKSYLEKAYQSRQTAEPQKEWLKETLEQYYNPQKYNVETATEETAKPTLIALFDEFLEKHRLSDVRKKNYRVIKRGLQRYELYIQFPGYPMPPSWKAFPEGAKQNLPKAQNV